MKNDTSRMYVLAGGGSGGHLYPGLAVAEALRQAEPEAEILFLATERPIDKNILESSGFQYLTQPIHPIPSWKKPNEIRKFWQGWRQSVRLCRDVLEKHKFAVVLGLGGFASGPALMLASRRRIPTAMLNPDAVPGRANRIGRRFSRKIFLQWETSRPYFGADAEKCVVTGCPIRDFFSAPNSDKGAARAELGLDPDKPTLVVMGGSQGGHNVNQTVVTSLTGSTMPLNGWQVLHLTGKKDSAFAREKYQAASIPARVLEFTDKMDQVLAAADLVLGRAGASSLAELTCTGLPSILLPYPYHKDQHQLRNAEVLQQAGAAQIVTDECHTERTAENLTKVLQICRQNKKLDQMSQAARSLRRHHAAQTVAEELRKLATN